MNVLNAISIESILLIIAGVSIFLLLFLLFPEKKRKYRAAMMMENAEIQIKKKSGKEVDLIQLNTLDKLLSSTKLLSRFSPYNVINAAREIEWNIGYVEYLTYTLLGGLLISFMFWVSWGHSIYALYGLLFGLATPRLMLYFKKKKFMLEKQERVAIFMKTMANSMAVFGNAVESINEVIPLVHPTIKVELEKASALMKSGKSLSYSFRGLEEKFQYADLSFFIDMLEVAHEHGGEYNDILMNIAEDFDQQKVLQMKLERTMAMTKRAFYQNASFVLILPVIFMFVQNGQLYNILMDSIFGKLALTANLIIVCFFWYKLEKISQFDLNLNENNKK